MILEEIKKHLTEGIIPFWEGLKDETSGGFYGYVGYNLKTDQTAVKGCILNSRILWFFSNAYLLLKDPKLLDYAAHAYRFLVGRCLDKENGGIYWSVSCDGKPWDDSKHTYNQAFAVYALSSYYDASKDGGALALAEEIYHLIETKCKDSEGYQEAFDCRLKPVKNDKLSENGVIAEKTMNTLLHVLEAYSELYRVSGKKEVGECLGEILSVFAGKVYNKKLGRQEVFFDCSWNSLIDLYSYGHDIETSWLLDRALAVLKNEAYDRLIHPITEEIVKNIYNRAYQDHSLLNETEHGITDTDRIWWVQAEAVVGFYNGYQNSPERVEYKNAAFDIWNYIKENMIDKRPKSEWFWSLDENKNPRKKPIVEPWKCPYHNGRMCIEMIRRMQDVT